MKLFATAFLIALSSSTAAYADAPDVTLPNQQKTPGDWFTRDAAVICARDFKTSDYRNVSGAVRKAVFEDYGLHSKRQDQCNSEEGCELDHLVSIELGGSNDPKNLWPQPYDGDWNAHDKDRLENELHKRVCGGRMTLIEAQDAIRTNWKTEYVRVFGHLPDGSVTQ